MRIFSPVPFANEDAPVSPALSDVEYAECPRRHRNFSRSARAREDISGLQQIGYRLLAGEPDPLLLGGRVEAYGDPVRAQVADENDLIKSIMWRVSESRA